MKRKHSYISTSFWDDAWIQELNAAEKLIYLYLMTSPLISLCGVYKITNRRIGFDTGYDEETVKAAIDKFSSAKKAIRFGEWIILPSWPEHQNLEGNDKLKLGIISELQELPEDVFYTLYDVGYRFDLDSVETTVIARKQRKKISGGMVKRVKEKSGGKCAHCGASDNKLIIHHIKALEEGGDNRFDNLEAICEDCYREIHSHVENEASPHGACGNPQGHVENEASPHNLNLNLNCNLNLLLLETEKSQGNQPADNREDKPPPPPTTTNFLNIQREAKALGYFISKRQASAFLVLDSSWLFGSHTFFDFSARKIRDDPVYSKKSKADRERIFAKGWKYENWIQEYPDWLMEQIKNDETAALERLKTSPPKMCPHCGAHMEGYTCPSCNGFIQLNEKIQSWEYKEPVDTTLTLAEQLMNLKRSGDKNKPP
jgi:hypothetical protein